jgi:hypothetical protein
MIPSGKQAATSSRISKHVARESLKQAGRKSSLKQGGVCQFVSGAILDLSDLVDYA